MLKKILIAFAILIPIIVGWLLLLPSEVKIRRSLKIDAPANKIYPYVVKLKNWSLWASWRDQVKDGYKIEFSFEGSEQGVGAVMRWKDPKQRGGIIEIKKAEPNKSIEYLLTTDNGAKAYGAIILSRTKDNETSVAWLDQLDVKDNLLARFFIWTGIVTKQVEADFDKGLKQLKELVEKGPRKPMTKKAGTPGKDGKAPAKEDGKSPGKK